MMKQLIVSLILYLPIIAIGQGSASSVRISKLIVDSRKSFNPAVGDSVISLIIDTLIMKDRSKLIFTQKKKVNLIVNYVVIGKDCLITGNDGKNNGSSLNMSVNFIKLSSLFIDVSGKDARFSNRHFDNGNGGDVTVSYLSGGIKPQITDKKKSNYLSVNTKGGGNMVNPQNDLFVIKEQIRNGSPGRPLSQLPNGRVYSANNGTDGKTTIRAVSAFTPVGT